MEIWVSWRFWVRFCFDLNRLIRDLFKTGVSLPIQTDRGFDGFDSVLTSNIFFYVRELRLRKCGFGWNSA